MDIEIARHVIRKALRSGTELEVLLPLLKVSCTAREYSRFRKAIASAMAGIGHEVINAVFAEFPELEQEVDEQITKHGRYL